MEIVQYSIISFLVIASVIFLVKKFQNTFKSDCTNGQCGCSNKLTSKKKRDNF